MSDTSKAVLLIADISGFTRFMTQKTISVSHAKQIVVRLLRALMKASVPPLKVAELEGDAVFFYALCDKKGVEATINSVKEQMRSFFLAFKNEVESISDLRTCSCDACHQTPSLKLKQVLHLGEVVMEKIDRFEKLFGVDVILVHRMLKNSVEKKEYVMMTKPVFETSGGFFELIPERRVEVFEGVGEVETVVFYTDALASWHREPPAGNPGASWVQRLAWRFELSWNFLLDFVRFR